MPFARPTLQELVDSVEAELAAAIGAGPLLPRSLTKILADAQALQTHGLHGHLAWIFAQVFPDTADTENLERFASRRGLTRKAAVKASGSVTFTGTSGSEVPTGTLLRRPDGLEFATTEAGTLAAGTATVAVEASAAGDESNTAEAVVLNLSTPVSGVDASATVAAGGITGGTDEETDAELLTRILTLLQTPPTGGSTADYVLWTLEVPQVTRAFALPSHFGIGTVGVTMLLDGEADPIPDSAKVAEVQAYIEDPTRKPPAANVTVFAPVEKALDPAISLSPNTATIQAEVTANLEAFLRGYAAPGKTIPLSKILEAISTAAGEEDNAVTELVGVSPADVTANPGEIVTLGTITFSAL